MIRSNPSTRTVLAFAFAGMLAIGPAMADKPSSAGGGKSDKNERADKHDNQKGERRDSDGRSARGNSGHAGAGKSDKHDNQKGERHDADGRSARGNGGHAGGKRDHFGDRHRVVVHEYYNEQFRSGRCPPGLAKKHNGCMPPGQAKKWNMGQPLPQGVVYYTVPQTLVVQFGQPPSGYRYVRVSSDILLMAIGTRMVVDAIQNLGRS